MSDILPVCLQDFLYSRKSELRKHIIRNQQALGCLEHTGSGPKAAACFLLHSISKIDPVDQL